MGPHPTARSLPRPRLNHIRISAVVIVEGEIDKLSLTEVGVHAAVSVPDGAPGKVKDDVPDPAQDKKYEVRR